jgi:hypothetical protein
MASAPEKKKVTESAISSPLGSVDRDQQSWSVGLLWHPIFFMSIQERFPDKSLIGSDGIVGNSGINLHETRCWPSIRLGGELQIPCIVPC